MKTKVRKHKRNNLGTYAVYGTLRKGSYNHRFVQKPYAQYLGKGVVKGFSMHTLGPYPYIVKTGSLDDSIVVEVYKMLDPMAEKSMVQMEQGAGYAQTGAVVNLEKGKRVVSRLFYFPGDARHPKIKSGDWMK